MHEKTQKKSDEMAWMMKQLSDAHRTRCGRKSDTKISGSQLNLAAWLSSLLDRQKESNVDGQNKPISIFRKIYTQFIVISIRGILYPRHYLKDKFEIFFGNHLGDKEYENTRSLLSDLQVVEHEDIAGHEDIADHEDITGHEDIRDHQGIRDHEAIATQNQDNSHTQEARPIVTESLQASGQVTEGRQSRNVIEGSQTRERYRQLLDSVIIAEEFQDSPSVAAVARDLGLAQITQVIVLAAKLSKVKLHRNPNAGELLSLLMDCDYDVAKIVAMFVEAYRNMTLLDRLRVFGQRQVHVFNETAEPPSNSNEIYHNEVDNETRNGHNNQNESHNNIIMNNACNADNNIDNNNENNIVVPEIPGIVTHRAVLERESHYLRTLTDCITCQVKPSEVTILPCGHFQSCSTCAERLLTCPVCHREILATVKTFLT